MDRYIAGVPCWADTTQPDPEAAVAFYSGLFGWECEDLMPPGSEQPYFAATIRGEQVAAIAPGDDASWNTYVWVDDADAAAAKVADAGGTVLAEPFDVNDAGRMAIFADPEGASFRVWQAGRNRGAGIVNEHGAVNFNDLRTDALERVEGFYGAVFGWGRLPMFEGAGMWTLPGYIDHLEQINPGTKENFAAAGAPPGFENAVASYSPRAAGVWQIVFGIDDADAAAERAERLGGTVVEAPHDAPWVRRTVIRDPQGVEFVASQFVPENR